MAPNADSAESESGAHAEPRTDRQSAGRSVDVTSKTLYRTRIAVQQARIDALESTVEQRERELQRVIERYEYLIDRTTTGEPLTDGGQRTEEAPAATARATDGTLERVVAVLRRYLP